MSINVPLPSQDNYKDLFDAILVYLDSFDNYANFQDIWYNNYYTWTSYILNVNTMTVEMNKNYAWSWTL